MKKIKALFPKFHRTESNRHAGIAPASHMSLKEISVGMMLGNPQASDITQVHHIYQKRENMFKICKDDIRLTHKKRKDYD